MKILLKMQNNFLKSFYKIKYKQRNSLNGVPFLLHVCYNYNKYSYLLARKQFCFGKIKVQ